MLARDTYLPQRTKGLRPESESPVFLVTPAMRSWNQFSAFIKEWGDFGWHHDELRRRQSIHSCAHYAGLREMPSRRQCQNQTLVSGGSAKHRCPLPNGAVEQGACSGQGVWRPQHVDESGGTSLSGKRADVLRACAHGVEQTAGTRLAVGCHPSADATIHTSPGPNTVQWLLGIGRRRRMQSCGNATRSRATGDARRSACVGGLGGRRGAPERTRACV